MTTPFAGYCQAGNWVQTLPDGGGISFTQFCRVAPPKTLPSSPAAATSQNNSLPRGDAPPHSSTECNDLPKQDSYPQGMLSAAASSISMADFGSASTEDIDMCDARSDASDRTNLGGSWLLLDAASPTASASGCSTPDSESPATTPSLDGPNTQPALTEPHSAHSRAQSSTAAEAAFNKVAETFAAERIASGSAAAVDAHMASKIAAGALEDPVWVVDLGAVKRLYEAWTEAMPRVRPFYAAKCNMEPGLMATLSSLGAGFDCASEVRSTIATIASHLPPCALCPYGDLLVLLALLMKAGHVFFPFARSLVRAATLAMMSSAQ